jgi:hypothetical protein
MAIVEELEKLHFRPIRKMPGVVFLMTLAAVVIFFKGAAYPTDAQIQGENHLITNRATNIKALIKTYGKLVEIQEIRKDDIVLKIRDTSIYYRDGKMLSEKNAMKPESFDSIFYRYETGPQKSLPQPVTFPIHRSHDFLDALAGSTEEEVRASCSWVDFLNHMAYMHSLCIEPLKKVDKEIRNLAVTSKEIRDFIANISVVYSLKRRNVAGTNNASYHSYGLAIDLIPKNYYNRQVYWRWSRVFASDWGKIPLSERWQPPKGVIKAFEDNGFIWGGKWYHFDTVHFEYRPEIIYLATTSIK